jgi:peptidoglycan/LPS O-acetylase OafA/YrhL
VKAFKPPLRRIRVPVRKAVGHAEFVRNVGGLANRTIYMRHRPDIDGLRAIAVVPVVLFHAGFSLFRGGYVGVDVFFVISGYLITSIIVPEIDANAFSLASFYDRRVRRIFPALIAVLAFCLVAGFALLTPADYNSLGQSAIAASFFVSNIFFLETANYFDVAANEKPLLHTWSLAIEEQYYLFYPLILVALTRYSRRLRTPAVLAAAVLSFSICAAMVYVKPSATFYLGPTRAWELLFGGLVALEWVPASDNRAINNIAALFGLACILAAVFFYSPTMRFPGIAALAPVAGAVLLIWSGLGKPTVVHGWLSARPITAVGKASYSLYLWHFPLLVFSGYLVLGGLGSLAAATICVLSGATSFLSLHFIERPFRFPGPTASAPRILGAALAGMAIIIVGAGLVVLDRGLSGRMTQVANQYLDVEREREGVHHWECMSLEQRIVTPQAACKLGAKEARPTALLWGDSHSVVSATAMTDSAVRNGAAFVFAASVDCPIGLGFSIDAATGPAFVSTPAYQSCGQYNREMLEFALANPDIKTVVLSSRWTNWRVGERGSAAESPVDIRLRDAVGVAKSMADNRTIFAHGFEDLVRSLAAAGKNIWIVGPIPEPSVRVPKALYIKQLGFDAADLDISEESFEKRNSYILSFFAEVAKKYPVRFIWPHQVLCKDDSCPVVEDGKPIFFDSNHLSLFGVSMTSDLYNPIWARPADNTTVGCLRCRL